MIQKERAAPSAILTSKKGANQPEYLERVCQNLSLQPFEKADYAVLRSRVSLWAVSDRRHIKAGESIISSDCRMRSKEANGK